MPIVRDPNVDTSGAKPVVLGGKEYLVAPLPLRQTLAVANLESRIGQGDTAEDRVKPLIEIVRRALLKLHPQATDEDLLDEAITLDELYAALPIVMQQAGAKAKPAEADAAGEARATTLPASTG